MGKTALQERKTRLLLADRHMYHRHMFWAKGRGLELGTVSGCVVVCYRLSQPLRVRGLGGRDGGAMAGTVSWQSRSHQLFDAWSIQCIDA